MFDKNMLLRSGLKIKNNNGFVQVSVRFCHFPSRILIGTTVLKECCSPPAPLIITGFSTTMILSHVHVHSQTNDWS